MELRIVESGEGKSSSIENLNKGLVWAFGRLRTVIVDGITIPDVYCKPGSNVFLDRCFRSHCHKMGERDCMVRHPEE